MVKKKKKVGVYFLDKKKKDGTVITICKINYNQKSTTFSCEDTMINKDSKPDIVRAVQFLVSKTIGFSIVGASPKIIDLLKPFLNYYSIEVYNEFKESMKDILLYREYINKFSNTDLFTETDIINHKSSASDIVNFCYDVDKSARGADLWDGDDYHYDLIAYIFTIQFLDSVSSPQIKTIDLLENDSLIDRLMDHIETNSITILNRNVLERGDIYFNGVEKDRVIARLRKTLNKLY